jgi:hypothetical protein
VQCDGLFQMRPCPAPLVVTAFGVASAFWMASASGVASAWWWAGGMFARPIMAGIAHMAISVPRFVCVEIVVRLLPSRRIRSVVPMTRIVVVVDMAIKSVRSVKPRAGPNEHSPIKPIWPVVAKRCTIVGRKVVVAVRTHGGYPNVDGYLRGRTRKAARHGRSESGKRESFQITHLVFLQLPLRAQTPVESCAQNHAMRLNVFV